MLGNFRLTTEGTIPDSMPVPGRLSPIFHRFEAREVSFGQR